MTLLSRSKEVCLLTLTSLRQFPEFICLGICFLGESRRVKRVYGMGCSKAQGRVWKPVGMLVSGLLTSGLPFVILWNNKKTLSGLKEPVQNGDALNHREITQRSSEIHTEKHVKL